MDFSSITADMARRSVKPGLGRCLHLALIDRTFRFILTLRLYQAARHLGPLAMPALLAHRITSKLAMVDLSAKTPVGEGLAVNHGFGLVVHPLAVIGRNVTLFQGVTLGSGDRIGPGGVRETGFPVIEDEVWIGPYAMILGDVRIGQGSRIMGGAVVTSSVPAHSMVAGNPGVIVRTDCLADVLYPADLPDAPRSCF